MVLQFLTGRTQRVKIGKCLSESRAVSIGIPQGSVLGSLLFLVYINDLPEAAIGVDSVLFADDAAFVSSDVNYNQLVTTFNSSLQRVSDWWIANRISLNLEKTVAVNFSKRKVPENSMNVTVQGNKIEFVE